MRLEYGELGITIDTNESSRHTGDDVVSFRALPGQVINIENSLKHHIEGIKTLSTTLGIKESGKQDFTVIYFDKPCSVGGVFTRNMCPSVTILRNRECIKDGEIQAIAVNSGNSNVFTPTGWEDLNESAQLISKEFRIPEKNILISSTGVIGVPLPMEKFRNGIPGLTKRVKDSGLQGASEAILTTDLGPKVASVKVGDMIICGIAKGAGMIEPNMATMLVYLFTNVTIESEKLQSLLQVAVDNSFNCISVDSDTSTSDTVAILSSGKVPLSNLEYFSNALTAISLKLARDIVSQGEGAEKIIEVMVDSDRSATYSKRIAKKIINSPLLKCAVHGADPNWGRVVMAIGKPDHGHEEYIIPHDGLEVRFQGIPVYLRGQNLNTNFAELATRLKSNRTIQISIKIGEGGRIGRAWGCDLTEKYIHVNADYTT